MQDKLVFEVNKNGRGRLLHCEMRQPFLYLHTYLC